jgi:RNA polymerase sigma factor for flagellar operon FliA
MSPTRRSDGRGAAGRATDPAEAWTEYRRTGSPRTRRRLLDHYSGQVRRIARHMGRTLPAAVEEDDLVQVGMIALHEVIDRFDPGHGARFETFSSRRISGAMQDYLRRIDHLPRLMREREKSVEAAIEGFRVRFGRAPDEREVCEAMGLDADGPAPVRAPDVRPMPAPPDRAGGRAERLIESLPDRRSPSPLDDAALDDLIEWITEGLPRRDRLMVILYYAEQLTMREVADVLDLSESRVSQEMKRIRQVVQDRLGGHER